MANKLANPKKDKKILESCMEISVPELAIKQAAAEDWRIVSLEMDSSGEDIGKHFQKFLDKQIHRLCISHGLYDKDEIVIVLKRKLAQTDKRTLAIYGNGGYHHYTYGLCKAADKLSKEYCYIHFDHHSDYAVSYSEGRITCGSFVGEILQDTHAQSAFFVGSLPWGSANTHTNFITKSRKGSEIDSLDNILKKTPDDVYMSFDLDVMDESEILTDFSRGTMKADKLLQMISAIKRKKRVISADILGYAMDNSSRFSTCEKSRQLYVQIAEAVLS